MQTEKERRALMRRIWQLNLDSDEGRYRLERTEQPWYSSNLRHIRRLGYSFIEDPGNYEVFTKRRLLHYHRRHSGDDFS
jgi:hypothetical protein